MRSAIYADHGVGDKKWSAEGGLRRRTGSPTQEQLKTHEGTAVVISSTHTRCRANMDRKRYCIAVSTPSEGVSLFSEFRQPRTCMGAFTMLDYLFLRTFRMLSSRLTAVPQQSPPPLPLASSKAEQSYHSTAGASTLYFKSS